MPRLSLFATVNLVFLFTDTNEGGAFGELFQLGRANIGTGGAHTAQNVLNRGRDGTAEGEFDSFPFRGAVMRYTSGMLLHRSGNSSPGLR